MREFSLALLDLGCNSLDAGARNLLLDIEQTEGMTVAKIVDDGRGMTAEQISKAMAGGYSSKGSSGEGISLARREAVLRGGDMKIASSEKGTTVTVYAPKDISLNGLGETVATLLGGASIRLRISAICGTFCEEYPLNADWTPKKIKEEREKINNFLRQN